MASPASNAIYNRRGVYILGCLVIVCVFLVNYTKISSNVRSWNNEASINRTKVIFNKQSIQNSTISSYMIKKFVANNTISNKTTTQNETQATSVSPIGNNTITIVVQLRGEMANNLLSIGSGFVTQKILSEKYGIHNTKLVLRHQSKPKWVHGMTDIKNCFPNLRQFDFSLGNTPEFDERKKQQESWLGKKNSSKLILNFRDTGSKLMEGLEYLVGLKPPPASIITNQGNISIPFFLYRVLCERYVDRSILFGY